MQYLYQRCGGEISHGHFGPKDRLEAVFTLYMKALKCRSRMSTQKRRLPETSPWGPESRCYGTYVTRLARILPVAARALRNDRVPRHDRGMCLRSVGRVAVPDDRMMLRAASGWLRQLDRASRGAIASARRQSRYRGRHQVWDERLAVGRSEARRDVRGRAVGAGSEEVPGAETGTGQKQGRS